MKRLMFYFIMLLSFSCQEDDVCVEGSTPNLVVKIYNTQTQLPMTLDTLYVTYQLENNTIDTLKYYNKDSVEIPLRIDNGPIGFGLIRYPSTAFQDSLSMNYTPKNEYSSKACGLKKVYENVNYQIVEQYDLQSFQALTNTISNSNEVHLNLYF